MCRRSAAEVPPKYCRGAARCDAGVEVPSRFRYEEVARCRRERAVEVPTTCQRVVCRVADDVASLKWQR
eukprot:1844889-Karenia_brevis.AAC.1